VTALDDLQRLGLVVGRVVDVRGHPGARAPSFVLDVDLGFGETHEATLPAAGYTPDDLRGRQVVCLPGEDELVVLGAHSHARGVVLLSLDGEVEEGTPVA
jgi:tRNA-binding EMAP/Myf-like protein